MKHQLAGLVKHRLISLNFLIRVGILGTTLLGNFLAGKGIVRAGSENKKGKGIVRADTRKE